MPFHPADILELLDVEEPNYDRAADLGDEAIPYLIELARSGSPLLAQKATAFAARVPSQLSTHVIRAAAQREEPAVRVAAAAALGAISPEVRNYIDASEESVSMDDVLAALLADSDQGVRRFAEETAQMRKRDRRSVDPSTD